MTRPAEQADPDLATLKFFERELPNRWVFPLLERRGPRREGAFLTYSELARHYEAELRVVPRLSEVAEDLAALAPDLIVSIRFSHIFSERLIRLPKFGIVNLHPGDLPTYAGLFTPFRQLLDGRDELCCSVHWIDKGIDTGPVLSRRYLPADPRRSLLWHVCQTYPRGIEPVAELVRDLERGSRPEGEPQDFERRHYHRLPSAEEMRRFRGMGYDLVGFDDYHELLAHYDAGSEVLGPHCEQDSRGPVEPGLMSA